MAAGEAPALVLIGDDFRNRFDGQLEYHRREDRFLLFYNTKYDAGLPRGSHHPRTRFSIAHELGHFYLDIHHAYLRHGGKAHGSRGEYVNDATIEREADAFAAGLLMPERLIRRIVNQDVLSLAAIEQIAEAFQTSLVSTALRCVELSDFPCALVALRDGAVAWSTRSHALIDAGFYPPTRGDGGSPTAKSQWSAFAAGTARKAKGSAVGSQWFHTFDRDELEHVHVTEHYLPVPTMSTLLVLLAVPEDELCDRDDD